MSSTNSNLIAPYFSDALLTALSDLHHIHDKPTLYKFVLNKCCDVLKAQGGTFYTLQPDKGELYPEASKGVSLSLLREIPFKVNLGVSGWVAGHRESVVLENAQDDERFNRAVDVITGVRTRSIVCVPIVRMEKLLGVIELINRLDGVFRPEDLQFVQYLVAQVGLAIENCDLFEQSKTLLAYTNSVINSLSGGFISTDPKGIITRCNATACRLLELEEEKVVGKSLATALTKFPGFGAILDMTLKHESPVQRQEIELQRTDGSKMIMGYNTFIIRGGAQKILGAGMMFRDITHLKHAS